MTANPSNIYPVPNGTDQRLTVDDTVGGVQFSAFPSGTKQVMFDVQTADVMATIDGSAPTTTNGHRLYAERAYTWDARTVTVAKFIRAGAVSGVIHASPLTQ